uniref:Uncharacterized protein n=1 Tax=Helianthus annuus TaxID=4232 RepID=A0A251UJG2_HELAN
MLSGNTFSLLYLHTTSQNILYFKLKTLDLTQSSTFANTSLRIPLCCFGCVTSSSIGMKKEKGASHSKAQASQDRGKFI